MPASLIESLAIGFGNIELAVGVLGEAFSSGMDWMALEWRQFSVSSRSTS